ncbi:MAG: DNA polymerase III subunit alpha [Spirochaetales bacterium]|uniref:DNA-directed DNA polymerase n=1 Tax=Candidatus Thalassospirochaeta sargassi TaxID=3119039 RepID=A0AAJ1IAB1_9SPIO|nr:DNA polymerase III subunit alpha [Spirochaetales bacterium]
MKNITEVCNYIHSRSEYSLLRGVLSVDDICRRAASAGERFAGITDINNLYALPAFLDAAEKHSIKPVVGSVITDSAPLDERRYLFTAYCLNRTGFQTLNTIISRLNNDFSPYRESGYSYDPVSDLLEQGREGLLIVSSRPEVLSRLREAGPSGLYTGLFRGSSFDELRRTAAGLGIKTAAMREIVCLDEQGERTLRLLQAVERGVPAARLQDVVACSALGDSVKPFPREDIPLQDYFSAAPEALRGTMEIADAAAAADLLPRGWVFPEFNGLSDDGAGDELRRLCREGIRRRYGDNPGAEKTAAIGKRLEYELNIICRKGFASYFLVVRDIVNSAPRTCGRGSAASSIVSYLLGITHVDPLAYNLFFERFLNMYRVDPPDIDVDFPWDEREKALNYVFSKYQGSSAMVADHVHFKRRGAAREAAKACGMTDMQANELMKKWRGGRGDELPLEIAEAAALLYGRPRYIGTHPGGVIITPGPITAYTHVQPQVSGIPVIAWEKDGAEACGLIKIDLLGNRSLAVLRDTINLVNPGRSDKLDWESFQPYSDSRTRKFIESGDTAGIFYIESPATRQLLKKMGCADFEHVVSASSIIRPAANKWINEYIRRMKGGGYKPLSPALEGVLDETYGIMVYQEDVARVSMAAAGFNPGEADRLRKTLSKKNRAEKLVRWRERFMQGAAACGTAPEDAELLWDGILSFDGYSFCKSHSASYALVSYRLAWLKLRYPLEFMVSVINNGGGFYARQVYLNIVRRMGFPVLKPDINRSSGRYTIETVNGIRSLRAGLFQIRELSSELAGRILDEREAAGEFRDFNDFISRIEPSYRHIRMMIKSGSLDSIADGCNRPQLFWRYYHSRRRVESGNPGLGGMGELPVPVLRGYSRAVCLRDEVDTLDLFFSKHPVELFAERAASGAVSGGGEMIDSRLLAERIGRQISITGTLAAEKEVLTSAKKPMSFISFEDSWSIFETVFFPAAWNAFEPVISSGFAFLISGTVESDQGAEYINVSRLICLNRMRTVG